MTFHESLSKSTTEWQISGQRKGHKNITYSKHYWGFRSTVLNSLLYFPHMIHYVGCSPPLHTPYISPIIIQRGLSSLALFVMFILFSIWGVGNKIFQCLFHQMSWGDRIKVLAEFIPWCECSRIWKKMAYRCMSHLTIKVYVKENFVFLLTQ